MKKIAIALPILLIFTYIGLSLLEGKGDYTAEKLLWQANSKLREAAQNPETIPDFDFNKIIAIYQKIIKKYPHARVTPQTHIYLGKAYLAQKKFDVAREKFKIVCSKYSKDIELCADSISAIGKSYEEEGKWTKAYEIYQSVVQKYPLTETGLSLPLYVTSYYRSQNAKEKEQEAYTTAIAYYRALAEKHPQSAIEFRTIRYLSNLHILEQNWSAAVETIGYLLIKYPSPRMASPLIRSINTIALMHLNDPAQAVKIYQKFIDKNPKHPLNQVLEEMITAFAKLKEEGVKVLPQLEDK